MVEAVLLREIDLGVEEVAETGGGEKLRFRAIGDDAAVFHHEDAIDLGDNVGDVVGDEQDASSLLRKAAEEMAKLVLRGEIKGVGGLVEEEHLRGGDESAPNHDASLLPGGHMADEPIAKRLGVDEGEDFVGASAHRFGDREIGPEGGAGEETGEDGIASGGGECGFAGKLGGDNAEAFLELGEVPAAAAEDADLSLGLGNRVALAGDGFDESGFTAAIGAEDGDVFAGVDGEVDVMEDDVFAAGYVDVRKAQEGFGHKVRIAWCDGDR